MTKSHPPVDISVENQHSLERLAWAIEASQGKFKLIWARCNYAGLRSRLVEQLQSICSVPLRVLVLKSSARTVYTTIRGALGEEIPKALLVLGLDGVDNLEQVLTATNFVREEFRKNFPFPLVFWVTEQLHRQLMELAPDWESWGTSREFKITKEQLAEFIQDKAEQFFAGNLRLTLQDCWELGIGNRELGIGNWESGISPLSPPSLLSSPAPSASSASSKNLESELAALLGFVKYVNNQKDEAINYYQQSLTFWQEVNNLERQGKLLLEIAFCYYLKTFQHSETNHPDWQAARNYLRQCLEVFAKAKRPDLLANSMVSLGKILRRLQDWERLQTVAEKALAVHQREEKAQGRQNLSGSILLPKNTTNRHTNTASRQDACSTDLAKGDAPILVEDADCSTISAIAQDYGFLAEVAVAQKRWEDAKQLAQQALKIFTTVSLSTPSAPPAPSAPHLPISPSPHTSLGEPNWYQFLLAQALQ
ncbi:MAG: tetratricopeptide repeat protein, partial [Symploca sp. SIO2G7]|nr:tetratricopeptide repeat protein [Symploca sp. SIO2G7]